MSEVFQDTKLDVIQWLEDFREDFVSTSKMLYGIDRKPPMFLGSWGEFTAGLIFCLVVVGLMSLALMSIYMCM